MYAVALDFHSHIAGLAAQRGQAHLRDQLTRASLSIVLNIAEGSGRVAPGDKGRFYAIARGSACECAAILDVIERCDGLPLNGRIARSLLVRIVQMLTRLGASMRARSALRRGAIFIPVPEQEWILRRRCRAAATARGRRQSPGYPDQIIGICNLDHLDIPTGLSGYPSEGY